MEEKLIDNKQHGRVGDVLKRNIKENSKISITASYFTLYAFDELKEQLSKIDKLRFIYTEPTFVKNNNKNIMKKIIENENKLFGVEEELKDKCILNQSYIARELAKWVKKKVEIKSLKSTKMKGALCHIDNDDKQVSITGATSLSCPSLGYINSTPVYLNIYNDDDEFNSKLKSKFDEIWNNEELLKDVKKEGVKIFFTIFWTLISIIVSFVEFMVLCWSIKTTTIKEIDGTKYCGVEYETNRLRKNIYYYKEYNIFAYHETKEHIEEFYEHDDYEHPLYRKYYN